MTRSKRKPLVRSLAERVFVQSELLTQRAESPTTEPFMSVIKPTVGRVVWYYPQKSDPGGEVPGGPQAATVAHVNQDGSVNLGIHDSEGLHYNRTNIPLVQPGDPIPKTGGYCCWMPYQIGQAQAKST